MERLTEWNGEQTRHAYYPRCFEEPCYGSGCKIKDCPFETDELMVMLRAGIISDLRLQPQFTLQESYVTETGERIRAIRYTADFSYKFGGKLVVEDVKSKPTRTKEYLRNRKFMRSKNGIDVQEI